MSCTPGSSAPRGSRALGSRLLGVAGPTRGYAVACAAAAITLALAGWLVTGLGGPGLSRNLSNVALCVVALLAAAACLARAVRTRPGRPRRAWVLIGLATLSWGTGQVCWSWYESVRGDEVPFRSAAAIGYLGLVPLTAAGLLMLPVSMRGFAIRARSVLDGLLIACSLLLVVNAHSSGAVIDLGWFVGFTLILLAAWRPPAPVPAGPTGAAGIRQFGMLLPYVAVIAALGTSVLELARTGTVDPAVSWIRSVLILLLVGRQVLTLLENRSLTRHLEARVADRTAELRASEQRFRALVQHSSDVVTMVDPQATVLYQSESVATVFGYPAGALTGTPLTDILDRESAMRLRMSLRQVSGRPYGTVVIEVTVLHQDGRDCHAEMTITNLLDDENVRGLVLNTRDISERKRLEEQLVHEAFHDALTKLANRALFKDRVDLSLRRRQNMESTVAVLFLDLDGFKEVNDSLGHAAGDELLIEVADRLRTSVRPEDTVARFGGDEFAVLIEAISDSSDAEVVAARIVAGLSGALTIDSQEIHVQASIGIAMAGPDAADTDQLMRNADLAMYHAKATGEGGFATYDPQMHSLLVERLQLEADLRRAIDADELELHYQPTIELTSGTVTGFEALVRWRHPSRGLVPPADFIPLAETTGLIRPIGQWVLREACLQATAWGAGDQARPLTMSVNVSGRQFDRTDLPATVAAVLAESGLPADRLCLEMTESVLMNDTEQNLDLLVRLKQIGVRLAIDDFGTGYSSLSYLRRFPVDTLKIDRSFVERLSEQSDDVTLARTIVQLGQSLGMSTVAEGIEQYNQLLALRRMGCELGQGYYFDRPLPAAEAGRLLTETSLAAGVAVGAAVGAAVGLAAGASLAVAQRGGPPRPV